VVVDVGVEFILFYIDLLYPSCISRLSGQDYFSTRKDPSNPVSSSFSVR
jgi:hypothetical protein